MEKSSILDKLSKELEDEMSKRVKARTSSDHEESGEVSKRVKARTHESKEAYHVVEATMEVQRDSPEAANEIKQVIKSQKQQTELLRELVADFAQVKSNVQELNSIVNWNDEEATSSDSGSDTESGPQGGKSTQARPDSVQLQAPDTRTDPSVVTQVDTPKAVSIFGQLAAEFSLEDKKGVSVSPELAKLSGQLFNKSLDEKKKQEMTEKYLVPDNVQSLEPPKVNGEIWRVLTSDTRTKDVKMQKLQAGLLRAAVPVIRIIDKLVAQRDSQRPIDTDEIVSQLVDSVAMTAAASCDVNSKRREVIKRDLNDDYQAICSHQNPVTDYLFGDNISEQLKSIAETNKVGLKIKPSKHQSGHRYSPYPGKNGNRRRGSFLDRGPPSRSRGRGRGRGGYPQRSAPQNRTRPQHSPSPQYRKDT